MSYKVGLGLVPNKCRLGTKAGVGLVQTYMGFKAGTM